MLEQCLKVQTIQAWGWFIRLLGHYAMENRCLVNNMLKVMEVTFTDNDTQVQISAQVFILLKSCIFSRSIGSSP